VVSCSGLAPRRKPTGFECRAYPNIKFAMRDAIAHCFAHLGRAISAPR